MNDATVNSVCLIDDAYLRFNGFLNNVKAPLGSLNKNFGKAVEDLTEAAVQDAQLAQNVVDIGAKFDILKQQAMWNKANVTGAAKDVCDPLWQEVIDTCDTAKAETDASGKEVNKALTDVQEVSFFLISIKMNVGTIETQYLIIPIPQHFSCRSFVLFASSDDSKFHC